jgi:DtxR family transcriptional regulator, Mn-dependent transcriptional regulator
MDGISMSQDHIEEYLGAIYRLRQSADEALPLTRLQEYFGFSPISIHEMVQKLDASEMVVYVPYRGVQLSPKGEAVAAALVRRHRIWERFLSDQLALPWDEIHEIAHRLEHAAPELVTERLADLMGEPESCPHGGRIPAADSSETSPESPVTNPELSIPLTLSIPGKFYRVTSISPEVPEYLKTFQQWDVKPGLVIQLIQSDLSSQKIMIEDRTLDVPDYMARTIRVIEAV